jgi:RimJ/RimL family protein N-acetyltransferase
MHSVDRIVLRALRCSEAQDIVAAQRAGHAWPDDYPTPGDVNVAHAALSGAMDFASDAMPWGLYVIVEKASNLSIGGIGFKSAPSEAGEVEIGYGVCGSFQGRGVATDAVLALCEVARRGATAILAETERENLASQRVLEKSGFLISAETERLVYWRRSLAVSEA